MASNMRPKIESDETLDILREISVNPRTTQRHLSALAGISLAKVNYLLRAMIKKGMIKTENFLTSDHKAACIYHLTPTGIEERTRITVPFLKKKSDEYERLKDDLRQLECNNAVAKVISQNSDGFSSAR
jgi:EPS-associated MarR family transcriptional regulator